MGSITVYSNVLQFMSIRNKGNALIWLCMDADTRLPHLWTYIILRVDLMTKMLTLPASCYWPGLQRGYSFVLIFSMTDMFVCRNADCPLFSMFSWLFALEVSSNFFYIYAEHTLQIYILMYTCNVLDLLNKSRPFNINHMHKLLYY